MKLLIFITHGVCARFDAWPGKRAINVPRHGPARCRWVNVTVPGVPPFRQCIHPPRHGDLISTAIAKTGRWKDCDELVSLWRETADVADGIYVDAGANIGSCSLPLLRLGARTVAFEPLPINQAYFTSSVLANAPMRWFLTLYPIALGNYSGAIQMYSQTNNRGNSVVGQPLNPHQANLHFERSSASIARLDEVLWPEGAPPPPVIRLMKIDVQGFEPRLFAGAPKLLRSGRIRIIKFELSPGFLVAQNEKDVVPKMLDMLKSYGYHVKISAPTNIKGDREVVARHQ